MLLFFSGISCQIRSTKNSLIISRQIQTRSVCLSVHVFFFQMAARVCAAGTVAAPWSRVAGAASARLDGVDPDAASSWKLTAVTAPTTMEVTFLTSSIICRLSAALSVFWILLYLRQAGFSSVPLPAKKTTSTPSHPHHGAVLVPARTLVQSCGSLWFRICISASGRCAAKVSAGLCAGVVSCRVADERCVTICSPLCCLLSLPRCHTQ